MTTQDLNEPTTPGNRARVKGSKTAELVAVSRARHLLRHAPPYVFNDPYARHFTGPRWRRVIESRGLDTLFSQIISRKLMPITTQHLVRARFAEDCLAEAIDRGIRQYMILGAGFDTFALRNTRKGLNIFEVELEATIAQKRSRMKAAGLENPPNLHYVPFDFECGHLRTALKMAGLKTTEPVFCNWMGVTYYLTPNAIINTLRTVADIAVPGSEIVFDYLIAECCVPRSDQQLFDAMMSFVSRRGEPMIARFDPALAGSVFNPDGDWRVTSNEPPATYEKLYLDGRDDLPPLAPIAWFMRLVRTNRFAPRNT